MSFERAPLLVLPKPALEPLLLQSGQLIHAAGTTPGNFGIYLEQPTLLGSFPEEWGIPEGFLLQQSYFYFRDATLVLPAEGWHRVPFTAKERGLFTTLETVVAPVVIGGMSVWRIPFQEGIPDIEIGWVPSADDPTNGSWTCSTSVQTIAGGFTRRDRVPWRRT